MSLSNARAQFLIRSSALATAAAGLLAASGCATGTTALWRAGASRVGHEGVELGAPRQAAEVEVRFKEGFGPFEETRSRRYFACATTTVLRKAFTLEGAPRGAPARGYEVLAHITTEEFPRDEERSSLQEGAAFSSTFGAGTTPFDLFEVHLDPDAREAALERLREYAGQLGADAVIEVFATGELEHHMWEGGGVSLDARSTSSPIHVAGKLLDPRLRDVRLHGLAVRYDR